MVSMRSNDAAILKKVFFSGVHAVTGYGAVHHAVRPTTRGIEIAGKEYRFGYYKKIIVVGAGKASFSMARAIDEVLGSRIDNGIVITKYGYAGRLKHIDVFEAGHPFPDQNGIEATKRLMSLAAHVDRYTLVLMLLSGGASSLLVAPDGVSLKDKILTTALLLRSGAGIDELNIVRKHLSRVKGGRLARLFYPARTVTLIISDVIGNRLGSIGSGPTVEDTSTPAQALEILDRFHLKKEVPAAVITRLEQRNMGPAVRPGPARARNVIIADNRKAVDAGKAESRRLGLRPLILTTRLHGEARSVGHELAALAQRTANRKYRKSRPICMISSGETTVTVQGTGKGGRSQELALGFAIDISGKKGITLLSAGTDGTDGPTDAAGALVDGTTADRMERSGMDPAAYLLNNDSYTVLDRVGALFRTGPTGTNVMDIQVILVS